MRFNDLKKLSNEVDMVANERLVERLGGKVLAVDDTGLWFNDKKDSTHIILWSKLNKSEEKIKRIFNVN